MTEQKKKEVESPKHEATSKEIIRTRNVCLTLNNYTEKEYDSCISAMKEHATYSIIAKEVGDSGTPHLQGYAEFKSARTFSGIKKTLGSTRYHLETRRGTPVQASDYCKKSDTAAIEQGEISAQGARTDYIRALDMLKTGTVAEAIQEQPHLIPMVRALTHCHDIFHPPQRREKLIVYYIYGMPGLGKSNFAYSTWPNLFNKPPGRWWDGYQQETTVLLDDFNPEDMPYATLLQILDVYRLRVEVKGGMVGAAWTHVVITSNKPFDKLFKQPREALRRRVSKFIDMSQNPPLPVPTAARAAVCAEVRETQPSEHPTHTGCSHVLCAALRRGVTWAEWVKLRSLEDDSRDKNRTFKVKTWTAVKQ